MEDSNKFSEAQLRLTFNAVWQRYIGVMAASAPDEYAKLKENPDVYMIAMKAFYSAYMMYYRFSGILLRFDETN